MMKKFYVMLVVLAMVCMSSIAMAADVTLGGTVQLRSRNFSGLTMDKNNPTGDQVDTQTRVQINVDAKAGDVKGKIALWNDFNTWGGASGGRENVTGVGFGNSGSDGGTFGFREAWLMTPIVDTGFTLKGGHMFLQLGQGGFFRSMHFGSDAWVLFRDDGPNHLGFVDVKISEGSALVITLPTGTASEPATARNDDVDAYVILDTYKISDTMTVGADLTMANDRKNKLGFAGAGAQTQAQNLGVNFAGKAGPVNLKAELDLQMGKASKANLDGTGADANIKGSLIYVRGDVPVDPVTVNFTVARGSGPKTNQKDYNQFVNFLDVDPHYTFLYEYKIAGACGAQESGFLQHHGY